MTETDMPCGFNEWRVQWLQTTARRVEAERVYPEAAWKLHDAQLALERASQEEEYFRQEFEQAK